LALPRQTSRADLIKKFRALGWEGPIPGTRHAFMKKGPLKVRVPNPHREAIGVGLLSEILKQAGITHGDWNLA
jgi:predicted RNA binding protein YcfA (HicA-like mRNA interferase family)